MTRPLCCIRKDSNCLLVNWVGPFWAPMVGQMACRFTVVSSLISFIREPAAVLSKHSTDHERTITILLIRAVPLRPLPTQNATPTNNMTDAVEDQSVTGTGVCQI